MPNQKVREQARSNFNVKWCAVCGRRIEWRRKWRKDWDDVSFCSKKCRRAGLSTIDRQLEDAILDLLENRPRSASVCPSEAARSVRPGGPDESWRKLMAPTRNAARRLAARKRVVFLQNGRVVDPSRARGPVRLKLNPDKNA